jgi:UDP-N-acetylmuramate--alanine ligase
MTMGAGDVSMVGPEVLDALRAAVGAAEEDDAADAGR